jgi:hypothetical protein
MDGPASVKVRLRVAEPAPGRIGMEPPGAFTDDQENRHFAVLRSPYMFLPPLRCALCEDVLPADRHAGRCTYCRKLKSDLKTGRKHPTDWGTARTRRLQVIIWHELTGQLVTDPYAPDEPEA